MNLYVSSWHARNKWKSMILNTNSQESFSSIGKIRSNEKRTNDLIPGINTITTTLLVNYKRCRIFSWIWKLLFMLFWFSFFFFLGPKVVSIIILWCIKFWSLLHFFFSYFSEIILGQGGRIYGGVCVGGWAQLRIYSTLLWETEPTFKWNWCETH